MAATGVIVALGGCDTSAGTAALAVGVTAGAALVGSQVATHSEVSVDVEVYRPKPDEAAFVETHEPAIARKRSFQVDPVLEVNLDLFQQCAQQVSPVMEQLDATTRKVRESVGHLEQKGEPAGSRPRELDEAVADLRALATKSDAALAAWRSFVSAVVEAVNKHAADEVTLKGLGDLLAEFRKALSARAGARVSSGYVQLLRLEMNLIDTDPRSAADAWFKRSATLGDDPQAPTSRRIARVVANYLDVVLAQIEGEKRKAIGTSISRRLENFGVILSADDLVRAYAPGSLATTERVLADLLQGGHVGEAASLVSRTVTLHERAYQRTFITITSDVNLGTIRDEVMQALVTSPAIPIVTSPDNENRWQPFSRASSHGRAGNHDAIIYLENLGLPILKSSSFDPTKFVVANGQVFRKAFSAMAAVYGVPAPAASDGSGGGGGGGGGSYNLMQADADREAAKKSKDKLQAQLVSAIDDVIAADKALRGEAAPADKAAREALIKKAKEKLQVAIDRVAKPAESKKEESKADSK